MRKSAADPMRLQAEHTEELKRLKEAAAKARSAGDESAEQAVEDLEKSALIQSITESLQGAVTDQNTAEKCDKQILELKVKLDHVVDNLERPSLVAEIRSTIEDLHEIAHGSANTQQKSKADNLVSEAEELISQNASASDLRRSKTKLRSLFLEILSSQPSFWVHLFQNLEKSKSEMSETERAERLIQQGRECMAKNNVSALENVARELLRLLPSRATKAVQRGYQSSLSK
jgi:DNA-binding protein H-NS